MKYLDNIQETFQDNAPDFIIENYCEQTLDTYDKMADALRELLSAYGDPETDACVMELIVNLTKIYLDQEIG